MDGVGEGLFEVIFIMRNSSLHQNFSYFQGISNLKPICNEGKGKKMLCAHFKYEPQAMFYL